MWSARHRFATVLLSGALAALGCAPRAKGPNVLIVVLDACRPDKMGCYGFERPTSPDIDQFAADPDSVLFERYYVQGSWTKPSTASLFTGLFMNQHHVSGGSVEGNQHQWFSILPDELQTLAEDFQAAGYYTFGATGNPHLDPRFGFDQGFDTYSMTSPQDHQLMRETLQLVEDAGSPFLGYVHFTACHYPFARSTRDPEYIADYGFDYDERARSAAGINFSLPAIRDEINDENFELTAEDVRFLNLIYEARMRGVNRRVIAPLLQGLRDLGVYDDTIIILTADHGEELYDHGGYGHGHDLWEEVVHVPLIVKFPKGDRPEELGPRWPGLTRAIDIYPSLAAEAGLGRPAGLYGRNIFRGAKVGFSLSDGRNRKDDWALVQGDEKVISRPGRRILLPFSGRPIALRDIFLFDLGSDPLETRNLASERPDSVAAAHSAIRRLWRNSSKPRKSFTDIETEALSEEAVETLKSLGYLD